MGNSTDNLPISSQVYNKSYLLDSMDGADIFNLYQGEKLPKRMEYTLNIAQLEAGQRVLDIGCGRGELIYQCSLRNVYAHGIDYAQAAVSIAKDLQTRATKSGFSMEIERASALYLPFKSKTFHFIFMLDIVEHLYPQELLTALREANRTLIKGGKLIIHTMPNADYYRWGYPIYRLLMKIVRKNLPVDPRKRWYRGETHVNIQNVRRLSEMLSNAGFPLHRIWLQPMNSDSVLQKLLYLTPARNILVNDIFSVATKE